jgi:hypothetical protein
MVMILLETANAKEKSEEIILLMQHIITTLSSTTQISLRLSCVLEHALYIGPTANTEVLSLKQENVAACSMEKLILP